MYMALIKDKTGNVICVSFSGWLTYAIYTDCLLHDVEVHIEEQRI